jgi:hypothetical protein
VLIRIVTGLFALGLLFLGVAAILSPGFRSDVGHVAGEMTESLGDVGQSTSPWDGAIRTESGRYIGAVTANALNIRSAPTLDAPAVGSLFEKHLVEISDTVSGDDVDSVSDWYQLGDDQFVSATFIEPFEPRSPDTYHDGHWLDVDLTSHYAVAYDGERPVHAAILLTGRAGWDTPEGEFEVIRRAEAETMDAGSIGIPEDAPNYYYLEDVSHVQYFAEGGYAIHGNDWSPPEAFGRPGSHGCINMTVEDAAFMWDFLDFGSPVVIAY